MGRRCENLVILVGPEEALQRFLDQYMEPTERESEYRWKEHLLDSSDIRTLPANQQVGAFVARFGCWGFGFKVLLAKLTVDDWPAIALSFYSSVSEPNLFLQRLSDGHPDLEIRHEYDADFTDTCGQWLLKNGKTLDCRLFDYYGELGDGLRGLKPIWPFLMGPESDKLFKLEYRH